MARDLPRSATIRVKDSNLSIRIYNALNFTCMENDIFQAAIIAITMWSCMFGLDWCNTILPWNSNPANVLHVSLALLR
jgi:hypothetical protein